MNTKLLGALVVAVSASAAAPAFATSSYSPAPAYNGLIGASTSQRSQSVQTLAAERDAATNSQAAYGGVAEGGTEAGSRAAMMLGGNLYSHH